MQDGKGSFKPYLNPLGAWALAFGCSIGWGAFLIPATFLPDSGVAGSIIGIAIGALIMLVIARNYHTMINRYPEAGGAFSFTSRVLGYDHGFLCGWFLCLTYLGLIWANISAFALLARYTLGGAFQGHCLYAVAGFDIYLEEVLLCMAAMLIAGGICVFRKRLAQGAQILFALVLAIGLIVIFGLVANAHSPGSAITPLFVPGDDPVLQVIRTIAVIPWAYVGFESISHSAEEFSFSPRKAFRVMALSIAMAGLAYVFMLLISVLSLPSGYPDWVAYVNDLDSLGGLAAVPTFSAIHLALGDAGIALLGVVMLGALFSSLVGNIICLSRLVCVMAEKGIFPAALGRIGDDGIPRNAILAIVAISAFIPFLGRTAIGWNVDVANIGATIAYAYTSIVAYRQAKESNGSVARAFGFAGIAIAGIFLVLMLLPNNALAEESYLIFTGWVILGFLLNHSTFKRDREGRYGRSTIVWTVLFFLSVYTSVSFVWQSSLVNTTVAGESIVAHYSVEDGRPPSSSEDYIDGVMHELRIDEMRDYIVTVLIIMVSVRILLGNYAIMNERELERERELGEARDKAYTDKLTGVKSVHAYREREREVDSAIEAGTMTPFAVAICDVNDVKEVNDHLGHQAGDDYIRLGSQVICGAFKRSPVYRIGGDEFVVLLEGADYEQRGVLARQFGEANIKRLGDGGIVIALGIADWRPSEDSTLADAFSRADINMYAEKRSLKALRTAR